MAEIIDIKDRIKKECMCGKMVVVCTCLSDTEQEPDAILEFDDGMEIFITFDEEDDEDGSG